MKQSKLSKKENQFFDPLLLKTGESLDRNEVMTVRESVTTKALIKTVS